MLALAGGGAAVIPPGGAAGRVLAVIGSAGRGACGAHLDAGVYEAMYAEALDALARWGVRRAASGGAAWADHLAVRAFLEGRVEGLDLFLPAPWSGRAYAPARGVGQDAGRVSNALHRAFSEAAGIDSLGEIARALARGARARSFPGFHRRNSEVADAATHMIAFTFGDPRPPEDLGPEHPGFLDHRAAGLADGGTQDTWNKAWRCEVKRHVSLNRLLGARGARVPAP